MTGMPPGLARLVRTKVTNITIGVLPFDVVCLPNKNRIAVNFGNGHVGTSFEFQITTVNGPIGFTRLHDDRSNLHLTLWEHGDLCQQGFEYTWNGLDDSNLNVIEYIVPERVLQAGLESFNNGELPWR
jgi:hypothetical protein